MLIYVFLKIDCLPLLSPNGYGFLLQLQECNRVTLSYKETNIYFYEQIYFLKIKIFFIILQIVTVSFKIILTRFSHVEL